MKTLTIMLCQTILGMCSFAHAQTSPNVTELINTLPEEMMRALSHSQRYEEYMSHMVQMFPHDTKTIDKDYVQIRKILQEASLRAQRVQNVLSMDMNNDGDVTRDEMKQSCAINSGNHCNGINEILTAFDANNDQKITYQEMRTLSKDDLRMAEHQQETLHTLLANEPSGDGVLTIDELRTQADRAFALVDTDHDRLISEDEKKVWEVVYNKYQRIRAAKIPEFVIDPHDELHVVGINEAASRSSEGKPKAAEVPVRVNRPNQKVTLLLTSSNPVRWKIQAEKGTTISKIFLGGHNLERTEIFVNNAPFKSAHHINVPYAYDIKGINFRTMLRSVKASTQRDKIESFHGSYAAPAEGFTISDLSDNPELRYDRLKVAAPNALPALTISGLLEGQYGEYTISGALVKKLPYQLQKSIYVADEKKYYALGDDGIAVFDEEGVQETTLPLSLDVPEPSHPSTLAYNPKDKTLVFFTLGGNFYSYHMPSKKWSVVKLEHLDISSLYYDPATGGYAAVIEHRPSFLLHLDQKGILIKREPVDFTKFQGIYDVFDIGNRPMELAVIPFVDYYVYVAGSMQRVYVQNRKTGDVQLAFATE